MAKEEEGVIEHELLPRDQFFVVANEESLCLREEEVAVDQLLDQDGSSSSKKVICSRVQYEHKVDMQLRSKIDFDRCQLNQKSCGHKLSLLRIRFGSELI